MSRLRDLPRRYRAAFADRRRVRSLAHELSFDEAYDYAGRHIGITQQYEEIRRLWLLVREMRPRTVVEIGLDEGGTLFLWTRAAASDAWLTSIDTRPPGKLGGWSPFQLSRRSFACERQRLHLLLGCDSHSPATVRRVGSLLEGAGLDFLFIDGDHSYEGVRHDFELYAPFVRRGGLIAFHDVFPAARIGNASAPNDGVVQFWREIESAYETQLFTSRSPGGFGIGVMHATDVLQPRFRAPVRGR
jgi:predicted O-methyltransferase YrrM